MDAISEIQWERSPEEDDGIVLEAMLIAEERGSYSVLKSFMSRLGEMLSTSPDDEVRRAYLELAHRADGAFKYEAEHGFRSLMKWDHPVNVRWVKLGLIKLSLEDQQAFEACNGTPISA